MSASAPVRSFGRRHKADVRDLNFPLQTRAPQLRSRTWASDGYAYDQGELPDCVGAAWCHWLHAAPIRQWLDPLGIYELAQHFDDWAGENYDGTSVRAAAKVLQKLGAIGEYRWTWDADEAAAHLLTAGPLVIGVDWYEGMADPTPAGLCQPTGAVLGGHAVCLVGYNSRTEQFRLKNSWGEDWALDGYAFLQKADLQALLDADGEACVGLETPLRPR